MADVHSLACSEFTECIQCTPYNFMYDTSRGKTSLINQSLTMSEIIFKKKKNFKVNTDRLNCFMFLFLMHHVLGLVC